MKETSKATARREAQEWPWDDVFGKSVLDVGPGDDPLIWPCSATTLFDKEQGDANKIDEHFDPGSFDTVHGSQVMEHLHNPADFIARCLRLLRPGGWIVMTVPDLDLYEHCTFPSRFNSDHKTTWSLWRRHWTPMPARVKHLHIYVPHWITQFKVAQRFATLIDTNYDYLADPAIDQSYNYADGIECWIEILLQK
jgi:SAM-dependent methyltransferase